MVDIIGNMLNDVQGLLQMGVVLMALVSVIATWFRTRAVVNTIGALIVGAIVTWGCLNYGNLRGHVQEDVDEYEQEEFAPDF